MIRIGDTVTGGDRATLTGTMTADFRDWLTSQEGRIARHHTRQERAARMMDPADLHHRATLRARARALSDSISDYAATLDREALDDVRDQIKALEDTISAKPRPPKVAGEPT